MHGRGRQYFLLHQLLEGVGQRRAFYQVVTVKAVLVELVQVNVVDACAGIDHAVVDNAALEVQYTEQLTGLHRHAVDRHLFVVFQVLRLIPGRVARLASGTDQATLRAEPVDQHYYIQLWTGFLGSIQGVKDFLAGLILLQVKSDYTDAASGRSDLLQQTAPVVGGRRNDGDCIARQGKTVKRCQGRASESGLHRPLDGKTNRVRAYTRVACRWLSSTCFKALQCDGGALVVVCDPVMPAMEKLHRMKAYGQTCNFLYEINDNHSH
ncbi:hypothetical protein ALP71_03520 [Pseudomonas coronafaciens pv. garcae]|nr:hypothetical protein ALP71_03520 [Pseudomonas coronafaciens pv. garcae]